MPSNKSGATTSKDFFSQDDVKQALIQYGNDEAKFVAKNPKLLKYTFDLLKAVHKGDVTGGVSAGVGGASASAKALHASKALQTGTRSASFVSSEFKSTMELTKATQLTSVGAVLVFTGATVVQKTGLAVSLLGDDSQKAKCVGALMQLGGSAITTAITAPTGVLLVLSLASLTASSYDAYLSCSAP